MNPPRPGVRYHAAVATLPTGEIAVAIAHMEPSGPVVDVTHETVVAGGELGIDAFYRGLRSQGIEVADHRSRARGYRGLQGDNIKARAIADALSAARAN